MKRFGFWLLVGLSILASGVPASAHHVIWLDFGNFNLNSWTSVNGNNPPTANDVASVRAQVVANMVRDYALVDLYFTEVQPANGRYTRVRIYGKSESGGLFGCAGPSCCPSGGTCTGIGTWNDMTVSAAEVYSGSFASDSSFTGANATTARIANGISHTASHELGHVLDLQHCNAADDSVSLGCSGITTSTDDDNVNWHIMASGSSWGLSMSQRATRDRFFSIHASRRILSGNLQQASHWNTLPNLNGGSRADLLYGRPLSPSTTTWYGRLSSGSAFGGYTTWKADAGDAGDIFLTGDVNNDNRADLVYGRILSATQVAWYVRLSTGSALGNYTTWVSDAGDAGDIFRLADVNGDNRDDLVYGRPLTSTTVRWYVRLSTGTSFGPYSTWVNDAGDIGDVFLIDDVDADGDADLVYGRQLSTTQVKWYARKSNGSSFGSVSVWKEDAGDKGDLFFLGDSGGDGDADLLYARTLSDTHVRWYYRPSMGNVFGDLQTWKNDAGDAGDFFRLGDGTGDGRLDLFYARPLGMTSLTATPNLTLIRWYGRPSLGGSFGNYTTWVSDAGDEGDIIP